MSSHFSVDLPFLMNGFAPLLQSLRHPVQPLYVPPTYALGDVDMTACSTLLALKHTTPKKSMKSSNLDFHAQELKTPPVSRKRKSPYQDDESDSEASITSSASTVMSHRRPRRAIVRATPVPTAAVAAIDLTAARPAARRQLQPQPVMARVVSAPKRAKVLPVNEVLPAIVLPRHVAQSRAVKVVRRHS